MSMIDHDTQDEMRARSAADLDARRYRHIASGGIYRIHSQARSPDGPICLVASDAPRGAMWTMQASASEMARTFVRCDGAHATIAPSAIPTPDAQRTRADAAEAECARLTTERGCTVAVLRHLTDGMALDHAYPALAGVPVDVADALAAVVRQRDAARERHGAVEECADVFRRERDADREDADALREVVAGLRAIVEGRTVAPTDKEIEVHERAGGRWRCALVHLRGGHDWMDDDDARAKVRLSAPGTWRWWALDATGRPCPWPTALDAGEGR